MEFVTMLAKPCTPDQAMIGASLRRSGWHGAGVDHVVDRVDEHQPGAGVVVVPGPDVARREGGLEHGRVLDGEVHVGATDGLEPQNGLPLGRALARYCLAGRDECTRRSLRGTVATRGRRGARGWGSGGRWPRATRRPRERGRATTVRAIPDVRTTSIAASVSAASSDPWWYGFPVT